MRITFAALTMAMGLAFFAQSDAYANPSYYRGYNSRYYGSHYRYNSPYRYYNYDRYNGYDPYYYRPLRGYYNWSSPYAPRYYGGYGMRYW